MILTNINDLGLSLSLNSLYYVDHFFLSFLLYSPKASHQWWSQSSRVLVGGRKFSLPLPFAVGPTTPTYGPMSLAYCHGWRPTQRLRFRPAMTPFFSSGAEAGERPPLTRNQPLTLKGRSRRHLLFAPSHIGLSQMRIAYRNGASLRHLRIGIRPMLAFL